MLKMPLIYLSQIDVLSDILLQFLFRLLGINFLKFHGQVGNVIGRFYIKKFIKI